MRALFFLTLPFYAVLLSTSPVRADEKAQSANTAIVPAGKLEKDFYEWEERHAAAMAVKDQLKPEVVLIGDSITHLWGGQPNEPKGNRGAEAWKALFGEHPALNLGFGWDRTQNVLKRIELGELDGLSPKAVVIHIGTNNLAGTKNARENTPDEIVEGIALIVQRVQEKFPTAKVIVMAVFPRGEKPDNSRRVQVNAINERLVKKMEATKGVTYLDVTAKLTNADGTISKDVMPDFLHPGAKGYAIWAEALKPVLPR
ncbi:GDSL-type esterase/lipase family protein [Roseimicrobium sp. ORNL1]|uniref:GDSL-type esterase/lipase family protein n=1 Tax=Roseimicrobium sp. ORNL1 TaxID=2711231 RepID=UPI0013E1219F|nr:GDSL-type esterase/lipase family protein [Roseimicrobium sp. ORNL1]QIF04612.1 acetylhydrolase [Roseimicrobium sp. ORNL1]